MSARRVSDIHRTAFVTGASAGLGRAFVHMLLADGVRVWGTARDPERLGAVGARYPGQFSAMRLDLNDPGAAEAAFAGAAEAVDGAFDLVVNNAGYGVFGDFATTEFAVWQTQLDALLMTTLRLSHVALRGMLLRNRGCLVNVSSLAVEFPLPLMSGYNVAKAGLAAFCESLEIETHDTNLTVIDFRPGDYRTDFNHAMQTHSSSAADGNAGRIWQALEANVRGAPIPARAAADLRRALLRHRSGVVRSGSFFQARLAPFLARLAPVGWRRAAQARYFGGR